MGARVKQRWFEIPLRTVILPDFFANPAVDVK